MYNPNIESRSPVAIAVDEGVLGTVHGIDAMLVTVFCKGIQHEFIES